MKQVLFRSGDGLVKLGYVDDNAKEWTLAVRNWHERFRFLGPEEGPPKVFWVKRTYAPSGSYVDDMDLPVWDEVL